LKKIIKNNYKKIGILGGTFDPPHKGHLFISKIALKKFKLNKLLWVVTKKNPLKHKPYLNVKTRIQLSKKIVSKEKKISIQFLDDKIKSTNTYNLLNYIKKKNTKAKLYFLMGADNLIKFHKWNNWKEITKLAILIVFARQSYSMKAINSVASKSLDKKDWLYMSGKKVNISSSIIRKISVT